jgi:TonB family protein
MTALINDAILAVSSSTTASIVAKVTIVTALTLFVAQLAGRARASMRHALLAAAIGALPLIPLIAFIVPPVRIELSRPAASVPATSAAPSDAMPHHGNAGISPAPARLPRPSLLFIAWMVGTVLFLVPVVLGLAQVRFLRRTAVPWQCGLALLETLSSDSGIRRRIRVLLHRGLRGPMTCGIIHPVIMMPTDAHSWSDDDLNRALLHELEHVRRGDWATQCLARIMCAVYWFHPLVWIASRQLTLEAERSCDDAVLGFSEATEYADQLLTLAQRLSRNPRSPLLGMANCADLSKRIGAVLNPKQHRGRAGYLPLALTFTAAALCGLAVSSLRAVAAPQTETSGYSTATSLVEVDVAVTDKNGKRVEGLSARDFAITQDGVRQTISIFESKSGDLGSYTLGYYAVPSTGDRTFRKIEVTGRNSAMARLDYRPGYYTKPMSSPTPARGTEAGSDIPTPRVLYRVDPEYSEAARKAKYSGVVVLSIEVGKSGRASDIKVVRSLGMGLDEKAIEAVRKWKFVPARKNGAPIAVRTQFEVTFRLW